MRALCIVGWKSRRVVELEGLGTMSSKERYARGEVTVSSGKWAETHVCVIEPPADVTPGRRLL